MIKKPEPGDGNATMQIDAVGDLEGIQLDDNEASDAPESLPPSAIGRLAPPPLPAFSAQPPQSPQNVGPARPSAAAPAKSSRNALIYGVIFLVAVIGIVGGVKLASALRGPAPVVSAAPVAPPEAPAAAPSASAASSAAPSAAPSVMRLDTIEVRDPPAETK